MDVEELKKLLAETTRGPWRVYHATNGHILGIGVDRPQDEDHSSGVTDGHFGLWSDGAEREANARLIALAPSLAAQRIADAEAIARLTEAVADMRERCAEVASRPMLPCDIGGDLILDGYTADTIAAAIRALPLSPEAAQ